ncbi:RNA-binding cell elongation regulator Jag/EloR [Eremococcus coleocola]|uniref:RNA-binding cell elongation regulator Jag/EloR n=1 Tax=Eremococcus coleocola TaxID=88132 RepID=UPI000417A728|nr:RNA-binding cell elongation regulator Jag/EloR [Eremococcus coleocola]
MLEHSITVKAETVDQAIEKGLKELGISRDQATVRVINEGKKGFFGFDKQDAVVDIQRQEKVSLSELTQELETKTNQPLKEEKELEVKSSPVETESKVTEVPVTESNTSELIQSDLTEAASEEVNKARPVQSDQEQAELNQASQENDAVDIQEALTTVSKYLEDIIREYGADASVSATRASKNVVFEIETDKSGLVIGKHGKIINSLQILAQTLLLSLHHRYLNVELNVGNYRDRRANVLEQMAENTAKEVIETRQPVILDALPAYERKQIHAHLSNIAHISTHSEGKEPNRYLVVEYVKEENV